MGAFSRFITALSIIIQQALTAQYFNLAVLRDIQFFLPWTIKDIKLMLNARLNAYYNPLVQPTQQEDVTAVNPVDVVNPVEVCHNEENNFMQYMFVIMSISFLIAEIIILYVWKRVKVGNETPGDIQVAKKSVLEEEHYAELRELHSLLVDFKNSLPDFSENEDFRSAFNTTQDFTEKSITRILSSNVSREPNTKDVIKRENFSRLRDKLQRVLHILEQQIDYETNIAGDTDSSHNRLQVGSNTMEVGSTQCYYEFQSKDYQPIEQCACPDHTNKSSWMQFTRLNQTSCLLENAPEGKSLVTEEVGSTQCQHESRLKDNTPIERSSCLENTKSPSWLGFARLNQRSCLLEKASDGKSHVMNEVGSTPSHDESQSKDNKPIEQTPLPDHTKVPSWLQFTWLNQTSCLLEKISKGKSLVTEEASNSSCHHESQSKDNKSVEQCPLPDHSSMPSRLQFTRLNQTSCLLEKVLEGKSLMTEDVDKQRQLETCREWLGVKEVLLLLLQHLESRSCRKNVFDDCSGENMCTGCSKINGIKNSLALNQFAKKKMLEEEHYAELKELQSLLEDIKNCLLTSQENEFQSPPKKTRYHSEKPSPRNLYSDFSTHPKTKKVVIKEENFSRLLEYLQRALRILQQQMDRKTNIAGDTQSSHNGLRVGSKSEEVGSMPCHCESQSKADGKSHVMDDIDCQKQLETCRECLKMKEGLSFLQQNLDSGSCRRNALSDYKGQNVCNGCSKMNSTQDPLALNLWNSTSPSRQKTSKCNSECQNKMSPTVKTGHPPNVTARNNSLNIEILFNRNIHIH